MAYYANTQAWDVRSDGSHDKLQMTANIRHLLKEKAWWGLPRYALGSSRGGEMALELALRFPLQVNSSCPSVLKKILAAVCNHTIPV